MNKHKIIRLDNTNNLFVVCYAYTKYGAIATARSSKSYEQAVVNLKKQLKRKGII